MTPDQCVSLRQYVLMLGIPLAITRMTPYLDWLVATLRGAM